MKILLYIFTILSTSLYAQFAPVNKLYTFGGQWNGCIDYYRINKDGNGDYIMSGILTGVADFDPGESEFIQSSHKVGGAYFDESFLHKLNSNGEFQWVRKFPYSTRTITSTVDEAGNSYLLGSFRGTKDFDPGPGLFELTSSGLSDFFLVKLNANGHFEWAKRFGTESVNDLYGNVEFVDDGLFLMYENYIIKFDSAGNELWSKTLLGRAHCKNVGVKSNGNLVFVGSFIDSMDLNIDSTEEEWMFSESLATFLIETDNQGAYIRNSVFNNSNPDNGAVRISEILIDSNDDIYLSGNGQGHINISTDENETHWIYAGFRSTVLMKLDSDFANSWYKFVIVSTSEPQAVPIALDQYDHIIIASSFEKFMDLNPDATDDVIGYPYQADKYYFQCFDSDGAFLYGNWATAIESAVRLNDMTVSIAGNPIVVGWSNNLMQFDSKNNVSETLRQSVNVSAFFVEYGGSNYLGMTGITENGDVLVYPNPVTDKLNIKSTDTNIEKIEILDMCGRVYYSDSFNPFDSIDVSGLSTGLYTIKLITDKGEISQRIVKVN